MRHAIDALRGAAVDARRIAQRLCTSEKGVEKGGGEQEVLTVYMQVNKHASEQSMCALLSYRQPVCSVHEVRVCAVCLVEGPSWGLDERNPAHTCDAAPHEQTPPQNDRPVGT